MQPIVESLGKALHGTAASAFILFGQVACKDLKLILAPLCKHMSWTAVTESQANVSSWYDFSSSPVISSLLGLPGPVYFIFLLDKIPVEPTKTHLFWFEFTNTALGQ